jgi:hypothetical protein
VPDPIQFQALFEVSVTDTATGMVNKNLGQYSYQEENGKYRIECSSEGTQMK